MDKGRVRFNFHEANHRTTKLNLTCWHNVTKEEVYQYSPGLLNILGVGYGAKGLEETCRQLYKVLDP